MEHHCGEPASIKGTYCNPAPEWALRENPRPGPGRILRGIVVATWLFGLTSAAFTKDLEIALQHAIALRDEYWACLNNEYALILKLANLSSEDFALYVGGACSYEVKRFRSSMIVWQ